MSWLDIIKTMWPIAVALVAIIVGYITFRTKQGAVNESVQKRFESTDKDISKNDDRINRRVDSLESTVQKLADKQLTTDNRLTKIETNLEHIGDTVDESAKDIKELLKQQSSLATALATKVSEK